MSDIIGVIQSVEDDKDFNQKDYKKVTLEDGKELKVKYGRGGALKAKWGLLEEGKAIKFTMTDFTKTDGVKIPFVSDIATVEGGLKPPQSDKKVLPEHQKEIDRAQAEPKKERNPQEVGLAYKILSELYVHGFIDEDKPDGKELVMRLKMWLKDVLLVH